MKHTPIQAKAVFFDVGHTILFPDEQFLHALAKQYGSPLAFADFCLLGAQCKEAAYRKKPSDPYKMWFTAWMTGARVDAASLAAIFQAITERHRATHLWSRIEPSVPQIFKQLRSAGFVLGVISNSDGSVESLLQRLELDAYFACILDSAVVGVEKPDARIFLKGAEALGVPPELCVYVGDQEMVDVIGARAVGMSPILLDPYGVVASPSCPSISRLAELYEIVRLTA